MNRSIVVYVDNFRGFKDTCIGLADVNFFVGENSSGKSSILSLINILSEHTFHFNHRFETNEVSMGSFRDIISVHSAEKGSFRVGYVDCTSSSEDPNRVDVAALMTFKEAEGVPVLRRYTALLDECFVDVQLTSRFAYFRCEVLEGQDVGDRVALVSRRWRRLHRSKWTKGGFRRTGRVPLPVILAQALASADNSPLKKLGPFPVYPLSLEPMAWFAPIRTQPKRTYDGAMIPYSPEGEHTPFLLRKMLESKSDKSVEFFNALRDVGERSGLFDSVEIRSFGRSATSPFELRVAINNKAIGVSNVGYGVSQSLPLIVETIARANGTCFIMQQPEVHLHPRAQAALGDLVFQMVAHESKRFVIETHSDFLLDRFRLQWRRDGDIAKGKVSQIIFFERRSGLNVAHPLAIDSRGELPKRQPRAYRSFFIREQSELLDL